jgi:hypothetical protein
MRLCMRRGCLYLLVSSYAPGVYPAVYFDAGGRGSGKRNWFYVLSPASVMFLDFSGRLWFYGTCSVLCIYLHVCFGK